jgi:hypothetical protein
MPAGLRFDHPCFPPLLQSIVNIRDAVPIGLQPAEVLEICVHSRIECIELLAFYNRAGIRPLYITLFQINSLNKKAD